MLVYCVLRVEQQLARCVAVKLIRLTANDMVGMIYIGVICSIWGFPLQPSAKHGEARVKL